MQLDETYRALDALAAEQDSVETDLIDDLADHDLVETYPVQSYETERGMKEERHDGLQDDIDAYQGELDALDEELSGTGTRLKDVLGIGADEREAKQERYETVQDELKQARDWLDDIEDDLEEFDTFTETSGDYARLTQKGRRQHGFMDAIEVDDTPYEESVVPRLEERYQRFLAMHEQFMEEGFENEPKVNNAAAALTTVDGDVEGVFDRAMRINNFFYRTDWTSYDRLRVVPKAVKQDGDIDEVRHELVDLYMAMTGDDHDRNYGTWSEAASALDVPGDSVEEKYERFDTFTDRVNGDDRSHLTCSVAARLAALDGEPDEIVAEYEDLAETMAGFDGRKATDEMDVAAMLVMQSGADDRAERFNETYETMAEHGWDTHTENYTVAAGISLLPGDVEENVALVDAVGDALQEDGFKSDLDQRALSILGGTYEDVAMDESFDVGFDTSSTVDATRYDDGLWLEEMAVIATPIVMDVFDAGGYDAGAGMDFGAGMDAGMDTGLDTGIGGGFDAGGIDAGGGVI